MKKLIAALACTLMLTLSAAAGEIPSGDFVSQPPPRNYDVQSNNRSAVGMSSDSNQVSLDAIQAVLVTILGLLTR
jgi:hypothetical protein